MQGSAQARGYRWNGEGKGEPWAWYVNVAITQREGELLFLREEVYGREIDLPLHIVTVRDRFLSAVKQSREGGAGCRLPPCQLSIEDQSFSPIPVQFWCENPIRNLLSAGTWLSVAHEKR
jgi:hypothetical protein